MASVMRSGDARSVETRSVETRSVETTRRLAPLSALRRGKALMRTVLSGAFVLLMLAAAHLFMVAINAAEHSFDRPRVEDGQLARLFTDRPLAEELEVALGRARTPEAAAVLGEALRATRAGETIEIRTLPVSSFIGWTALALCLLGLVIVWWTSRLESDAAQTILGIFGGNLIWTGGIEYGLTIAARSLGIGKAVTVVDGQLVAVFGEYVLLKHTWGAIVLVMAYLLFLESSRCPIFLWWRERVPTMRGPLVSGRIGNYGPRSAFQYATTVWAFYLLLLWVYDETLFGVYSWATQLVLFASLAGSVFCVWRLHQQTGWGPSVRYAVAAMIVVWTPIEILAKWNVLREPWLLLRPSTAVVFFGGLALGTWALWRAQRRRPRVDASDAIPDTAAPARADVLGTAPAARRERDSSMMVPPAAA